MTITLNEDSFGSLKDLSPNIKSLNLSSLMDSANALKSLGYNVGLASGKHYLGKWGHDYDQFYKPASYNNWNALSLILDNIVCIDFDQGSFIGLDEETNPLPPTMVEKTPNGLHFYFKSNGLSAYQSKIKWKYYIDLLVSSHSKKTSYGKTILFGNHAVCAPSPGYELLTPLYHRDQLPLLPPWVHNALIHD